jgi:hypothetical protein
VSTDDPQRTPEWEAPPEDPAAPAEARAAELRSELAQTDARRAEEETGKAHEAVEEAQKAEEKLSRKEHELKERAERVQAEAAEVRRHAQQTTAAGPRPSGLSGGNVTSPGIGSDTDPAAVAAAAAGGEHRFGGERAASAQSLLERPEVRAGLAFGGAFLAARILKRIFD